MSEVNKSFDPTPVSEDMREGPFPPPELDDEPTTAQWIMNQAQGDPRVYQLLMLKDSLLADKVNHRISDEAYESNKKRLDWEIIAAQGKPAIAVVREHRQEAHRRALHRRR